MRKILALIVLLAGPSAAYAVPTAFYNPITGNIKLFNDTAGALGSLSLISSTGDGISAGLDIPGTTNDSGDLPLGFTYFGMPSHGTLSGSLVQDYNTASNAGNMVAPNTPVGQLSLEYRISLSTGGLPGVGAVVQVPEPATVGLAGMALVGLAVRRRKS